MENGKFTQCDVGSLVKFQRIALIAVLAASRPSVPWSQYKGHRWANYKPIKIRNMKVEINHYLLSRIESWAEGASSELAQDLLHEVVEAIGNQRVEDKNHIQDLIDGIN